MRNSSKNSTEQSKEQNKTLSEKIQKARDEFWHLLSKTPYKNDISDCFGIKNQSGVDGWDRKTSNTFTVKARGKYWWEILDEVVFHPRATVCAWNVIREHFNKLDDEQVNRIIEAFSLWMSSRNALIENNIFFATHVVSKRFNLSGSLFEEAVSVARLSISVSVEMYNPEKGAISTYLYPRITRDVYEFLSRISKDSSHANIDEINEFEEESLKTNEIDSVLMLMDLLNSCFYGDKKRELENKFFGKTVENSTVESLENKKEYDILLKKIRKEIE